MLRFRQYTINMDKNQGQTISEISLNYDDSKNVVLEKTQLICQSKNHLRKISLKQLVYINTSLSGFTGGPSMIYEFIKPIFQCNFVTDLSIDLSWCPIDNKLGQSLGTYIAQLERIRRLRINVNGLAPNPKQKSASDFFISQLLEMKRIEQDLSLENMFMEGEETYNVDALFELPESNEYVHPIQQEEIIANEPDVTYGLRFLDLDLSKYNYPQISSNLLSPRTLVPLARLINRSKELEELQLDLRQYIDIDFQSCQLIHFMIQQFDLDFSHSLNLRKLRLDLRSNKIGFQGVTSLAQTISTAHKLTHLKVSLPNNGITEEGGKLLVANMTHLKSLEYFNLNINSNGFQNQAIGPLAKLISQQEQIVTLKLNIGANCLWESTFTELNTQLTCSEIQYLSLNFGNQVNNTNTRNYFSVLNANQLAQFLKCNGNQLKRLKLDFTWNRIENEGAKAIVDTIEQLPQLNELSLNYDWNRVEEEYSKELVDRLNKMKLQKCKVITGYQNNK